MQRQRQRWLFLQAAACWAASSSSAAAAARYFDSIAERDISKAASATDIARADTCPSSKQGQCGAYFESMAVVVNISEGELFEELAVSGCGETCVQSVGQPQLTQDILERTRLPA